jgi:hypothetical protein
MMDYWDYQAMRQNAERYEWLRDHIVKRAGKPGDAIVYVVKDDAMVSLSREHLDAEIDAAMHIAGGLSTDAEMAQRITWPLS